MSERSTHADDDTVGVQPARRLRGGEDARKTHCKHGHEFTPENTRMRSGQRRCLECDRRHKRDHIARKRRTADRKMGVNWGNTHPQELFPLVRVGPVGLEPTTYGLQIWLLAMQITTRHHLA